MLGLVVAPAMTMPSTATASACLSVMSAVPPPLLQLLTRPRDQRPITVLEVIYRVWSKGVVLDWAPTLHSYLGHQLRVSMLAPVPYMWHRF